MEPTTIILPLAGLISGIILGFIARRNFFCTLSSLEQHWYANNSNGVKTWALSAVVAVILTQLSIFGGLIDTSTILYLTPNFSWLSAIVGGLAFGFGMALIGTCGYGALVRLGGGSLKSLMAILVLGIAALSTQRGILAFARTEVFNEFQIDFSFAGNQSIPSILSALSGYDLKLITIAAILAPALYWIFKDKTFRHNRTAIFTGSVVGTIITIGWLVTTKLSQESFDPIQIESASFVAPISDTILQFGVVTGAGPDYGVGMVIGTVLGSVIAARTANNVRWEACDDARELSRHIAGATLMGFGGVLALGCTIGQGVSAASLLAISVPITMASIILGARMGLAWLLEGSTLAPFRN